jgi:hypothetical protein
MDVVFWVVTFQVASKVAAGQVDVAISEIEVFVSRT